MDLQIVDLGHLDYAASLNRQYEYLAKVQGGNHPDSLLLVEHQPVITMGRHADASNVLGTPAELKAAGIDVYQVERGGDATYHGPGQIVGYPIVDIRKNHGGSIKRFVHNLEEVFIDLLDRKYGIQTGRSDVNAGVWYGDAKLVAIGLAVKQGVTFHGFAFNVNTILAHFDHIVPCGLKGKTVTSLERLLGQAQDIKAAKAAVVDSFAEIFGYNVLRPVSTSS